MSLTGLIKKMQEITRKDSGIDGDAQRLQQIVWLIFLMIFDFKEEEMELDDDYEPVIPEGYRWRDWAAPRDEDGNLDIKNALTGAELINFVNNRLLPVLGGNAIRNEEGEFVVPFDQTSPRSLLVKEVMGDANNFMKNGYLLREVINLFNDVDLTDTHESHDFNDIYESLLKDLQSSGTFGEFYTNRAITSFVVDKLSPKLGGTFADWAAGTGGFLVDAYNYMEKQVPVGDLKARRQLQYAVRGGEYKPLPYKLLVTNLLLHGVENPNIRYGDSLEEKGFSEYMGDDLVDWAGLNPPYGGVALEVDKARFPATMRSSETADLFLLLALKRLKNGGKGGIVLPDGFLFNTDNTKQEIKKYLLENANLHTVIRLPGSCFAPYTSIATNLLFFDKGKPTENVWFYRMDLPDGKKFSKTKNPMKREHFKDVDEWWDNRREIQDEKEDESMTQTWKSKQISIDEIKENNYNLDYCGFPTEEKVILSPEETIANFLKKREKLTAEFDAKLKEIMDLLEVKI